MGGVQAKGIGRLGAALMLGLLAGACADQPQPFQPSPLDYRDRMPLDFAVEEVTITSLYQSPQITPFVDHTIQPTPEVAARALLQQRLRPVGGTGVLQAVIVDASVIAIDVETQQGVSGYLIREAETMLEGRLRVRLDHVNDAGEVLSSATTGVTRTRGILEDVGYADRQRIAHELVRALVDDLDSGLISNLQGGFADILRP